jgi:hypothetical protein
MVALVGANDQDVVGPEAENLAQVNYKLNRIGPNITSKTVWSPSLNHIPGHEAKVRTQQKPHAQLDFISLSYLSRMVQKQL